MPTTSRVQRLHLGRLWSLPNTAVGLVWGALGLAFGARLGRGNNALQFTGHPFMLPKSAVALGNTIAYGRRARPTDLGFDDNPLGDHERQHTIQGEQLGPFYLPSHLIGGVAALVVHGNWYGSANWNERGPQSHPPRPW